ncbi:MAG: photosynthetic complex assembly protein PuhC [Sphingomonadaceae bacterium]
MSAHAERPIPKPVLWAIFAVVALTFALTGATAVGLLDRPKTAQQARIEAAVPVVSERILVFRDQSNGTLAIYEGQAPEPFATIAGGSNEGFVRGVIRSMGRERRMKGVGPEAPYHLRLWSDGRLSLEDLGTGRTVELDSFGADNRLSFLKLLPAASDAEARRP